METEFQKNYWMHRVSYDKDIKRTLLEKDGLLITGWNNISNDTFLKEIEGKERTEYDIIYEKYCGKLSRNRFCLYLFLCRFQKGDYVIVPDTEIFSVYELVSDKAGVPFRPKDTEKPMPFRIGGSEVPNDTWNGAIDEVAIESTARSAEWVKAEYEKFAK